MTSDTIFYLGSLNIPGPYFHANGEGLSVCLLNESTGQINRVEAYPLPGNIIWLARADASLLTATENYMNPGKISAWESSTEGVCSNIGLSQSSLGGAICHIAVSPDLRTVFVISYLSGITVHSFNANDGLSPAYQHITYTGSGPNLERQSESHPHQAVVAPDGSYIMVCDLGCDKIWEHPFDGIKLGEPIGIKIEAGSGPRHLIFHPDLPRIYLLGELDAKLRVLERKEAIWHEIAVYPTLPEDFSGDPSGSAIHFHPSGKSLFVSNRNCDTITTFTVDVMGGLKRSTMFYTHGHTPREFSISPSGRWLLVANQDSHQIIPFELDPITGIPNGIMGTPFACGSPMCLLF